MNRSSAAFLALILAQAAHSIEEYVFRLYDVLAPARFVSGLVGVDRQIGFVIVGGAGGGVSPGSGPCSRSRTAARPA